jgi:hypothetical protein
MPRREMGARYHLYPLSALSFGKPVLRWGDLSMFVEVADSVALLIVFLDTVLLHCLGGITPIDR